MADRATLALATIRECLQWTAPDDLPRLSLRGRSPGSNLDPQFGAKFKDRLSMSSPPDVEKEEAWMIADYIHTEIGDGQDKAPLIDVSRLNDPIWLNRENAHVVHNLGALCKLFYRAEEKGLLEQPDHINVQHLITYCGAECLATSALLAWPEDNKRPNDPTLFASTEDFARLRKQYSTVPTDKFRYILTRTRSRLVLAPAMLQLLAGQPSPGLLGVVDQVFSSRRQYYRPSAHLPGSA